MHSSLLASQQNPPDKHMLQILQTVSGQTVGPAIITAVRGMAKVFVGELVEAGEIMHAVAITCGQQLICMLASCSSAHCS